MDIEINEKKLLHLGKFNILLGKNGTGKSTLLRSFEQAKGQLPNVGIARYITPERGGQLIYEGGVDTAVANNPNWGDDARRKNRFESFRQLSVTEFRRLETLVLRKIEKDHAIRGDFNFSFDDTLNSINGLLDNIKIARGSTTGFEIFSKDGVEKRSADNLSSGESELVSLGIEILSFAYSTELVGEKTSYLFLDEPDVHLHPDLQARLVDLLISTLKDKKVVVIVAHSTAILGALSQTSSAHVGFINSKEQPEVVFDSINDSLRKILPIFGAHPLSNIFNQNPIMLVEGEDDERIWQQAVRSSQGKIAIWPCSAGDIQSLDEYEQKVEAVSAAIYENAKAFSLRDRDDAPYEIDDKPIVKRMRLFCRAAENLILSDDVLSHLNMDWPRLMAAIEDWLSKYPEHPQYVQMMAFKEGGYNRRDSNLKPLRNIFMMLAGSQKAWEIAVGQAIASLKEKRNFNGDQSLTSYLGPKIVDALSLSPQLGAKSLARIMGGKS